MKWKGRNSRAPPTLSKADTQLLPVLRSESMQNLVTFGFTVFSTCRVSPASACAAHRHAVPSPEVKRHAYRAVSVGFCVLEGGRLSDMRGSYV